MTTGYCYDDLASTPLKFDSYADSDAPASTNAVADIWRH